MSTGPLFNRRAYFRQPVYSDVELRVPGMRSGVPSTLVDISGGGCAVTTRLMLKQRTAVEFDLPVGTGGALTLAGQVTKVRYTPTDRTFRYGIVFDAIAERDRESLLRFISDEQRRMLEEKRLNAIVAAPRVHGAERRKHPRVHVGFPVAYSISGVPTTFGANALDIGIGGIRLSTDRILRREWTIDVRFTLPNDVLRMAHQVAAAQAADTRPFQLMRVRVHALAGVMRARDRYIQRLAFVNAPREVIADIARFVDIVQSIPK